MLKKALDTTNQMIEILRLENDILSQGRYAEIQELAQKKDKMAEHYQSVLSDLKGQTDFLKTLSPKQKKVLRERFSLCKELGVENKKLAQRLTRAYTFFFKSFMQQLNLNQDAFPLYTPKGNSAEKPKLRVPAISVDGQY